MYKCMHVKSVVFVSTAETERMDYTNRLDSFKSSTSFIFNFKVKDSNRIHCQVHARKKRRVFVSAAETERMDYTNRIVVKGCQ